jgi:hypothetical protein
MRMQAGAQRKVYKGRERWVQFGARGMADILAFPQIGGVPFPVWVECKSATGKLSRDQQLFRQAVMQQGHYYLEARSAAEVHELLDDFERLRWSAADVVEHSRRILETEGLKLRAK